jgi:predicted nucleic acid-binding protein
LILVDTSVWVDHFRGTDERLAELLRDELVSTHPFVIGELALGGLDRRPEMLALLADLPLAAAATHEEVMTLVTRERLSGAGIGWVDVHLLAATAISGAQLWTRDGLLKRVAERLGLSLL